MNEFINLDDLDWGVLQDGEIGVIKAPTGYGKTYLAVNDLQEYFKPKYSLIAEPTNAIKWQTVKAYENTAQLDSSELLIRNSVEGVRVCCFAAIAQWLGNGNEITNTPDLLILDEIDELAKWSMCFPGYSLAWDWVLSNRDKMKVVGLSATPELLTDYVSGIRFVNVAKELEPKYKARTVQVIQHSSVRTYLKTLNYSEENKVIVYLQSAKLCAEMAKKYPNAGFIISEHNEDLLTEDGKPLNQLMKEQVVNDYHSQADNLRDYVLLEQRLPQGFDLLFFNDSCHYGLNIKDEKVKHIICETVEQSAIIQSIGRVRHDLESITVITNNKNKEPFFANLERARRFFNDSKIDLYTWNQAEQEIIEKAIKSKKRLDIDILTFRTNDRTVKVNPFAKACYEYLFDIYQKLDDKDTAARYFESVLRQFSQTKEIIYLSADEVKARAMNASRFDESIIAEYLDRDLFKAEKKEITERICLVDKWRDVRGWTTLKKHLKQNGYQVRDGQKKNPLTSKRESYSVISKPI